MITFPPKKGIKPILTLFKFLSLLLIPTFIILLLTEGILTVGLPIILGSYFFVALVVYLAQKTTKYWIDGHQFYYRSLYIKGSITIDDISKIEVNTDYWLSGMPATSNTNGLLIHFKRMEEIYISPDSNQEIIDALLKLNPDIKVIEKRKY